MERKDTFSLSISKLKQKRRTLALMDEVLFLKGVELFRELPTEELAKIAQICQEILLQGKDTVFKEGDPGDSLYIVGKGKIGLYKGEKQIEGLSKGDCFGELAILDREPRNTRAVAAEESLLLKIEAEDFSRLLADNAEMVPGIFKVLAKRIRKLQEGY